MQLLKVKFGAYQIVFVSGRVKEALDFDANEMFLKVFLSLLSLNSFMAQIIGL
jgi:hypothetical protein